MDHADQGTNRELVFSFGPFRLIPSRQLLLRGDGPVKLGGRALELLHLLVRRGGELVTKAELMAVAWPDVFVHESNLKVNMHGLRRSLGDTQAQPRFIATVAGRGYRFVAPVETAALDSRIEVLAPASSEPQGLPPQRGLVARESEIVSLRAMLETSRHVTVVGAGGVGKTTVAVAVAHAVAGDCPDGVCFADLSTIEDPALLPAALVAALGLRGNPPDLLAAVIAYLRKRRMLVLLDNCEHVLPAAAIFAHRFAAAGGPSRLLATSREPLGTPVEQVFWLGSLAVPEAGRRLTAQEALRYPALQLFVRRAADLAGYRLDDADSPAVAEICRRLDGLPLAIELAAGKVAQHSARDLLEMLGEHLPLQAAPAAGSPARQATLRATIDWSFRLLSRNEAAIFQLVSVFADAFDLDDVVAIGAAAALNAAQVTIALGGLVAKSLLTAQEDGGGLRYRLLDSTRRYAGERRQQDAVGVLAPRFHAERMLALFQRSEQEWDWREAEEWTGRYRERLPDLRAALAWAFGDGGDAALGIRLTVAALPLWFEMSLLSEAQAGTELALARAETVPCDDLQTTKLACSLAWSTMYGRRLPPEVERVWRLAIAVAERGGHVGYRLQGLVGLAFYLMDTGRLAEAIEQLEEFRAVSRRHDDRSTLPEGERALAWVRAHTGALVESRLALDRLAALHAHPSKGTRMAGFQVDRYIGIRCYLPLCAWLCGHPDTAAATARDAVAAASQRAHLTSLSNALALAALPISFLNGDLPALERGTAQLRSILEMETIGIWIPVERFFTAALADLRGEPAAVLQLRDAIDALIDSRFTMRVGFRLAVLADACVRRGRLDEAHDAIALALRYQREQDERWCGPELLRIEASILRRAGQGTRAERLLQDALAEARALGAVGFELRIASDLAAGYLEDERCGEAARLLEPIYRGFSEGFATRDLLLAGQLLNRANRIAA